MIKTTFNEIEIKQSLVEVEKILEKLNEEEYLKIPNEFKNYILENKDNEYIWEYDSQKPLQEQDISICSLAMLAYINSEYLLNDRQKEYMEKVYEENDNKLEQELREKNNPDDIFKNRKEINIESDQEIDIPEKLEETQNTELVKYKESIFKRIINKILSFFK